MRVGIMAEFVGTRSCGPATYIRTLVQGLASLGTPHQYYPYLASRAGLPLLARAANITPRLVPPYSSWVRIPLTLPAELVRRPVDLLHAQLWAPPWTPCPVVASIPDLLWEKHPETYTRAMRWRLSPLVRHTARRAVRVITVSSASADDLMQIYGVEPERIRVVHSAIDAALAPSSAEEVARVRARLGITRPYILYLGVIEPKKNIDGLVRAYAALRRQGAIEHQLVIAGRTGWKSEPILELARSTTAPGGVILAGDVPQNDVAPLLSGADLFAFLSLGEGFGLPPVEAMACGTPVLASNNSSMPEVLGDAALLVDPLDANAVVHSLRRVLVDVNLRHELRARGLRRAMQFQPEARAREIVNVYEECLENRSRVRLARPAFGEDRL